MPIDIVRYKDTWPQEFKAIAADLREALGDKALRIDHIGSTSVPGLAAKDIIDVQVTVADLSDSIVPALTAISYVHKAGYSDHRPPGSEGPDEDWQKFFFNRPAGQRRINVHVRVQGRGNQRYALLFRDYLRAHPASAAAYAQLKLRLAALTSDVEAYVDVKDPAVDLIMFAAEVWARPTKAAPNGWQVGTSDG